MTSGVTRRTVLRGTAIGVAAGVAGAGIGVGIGVTLGRSEATNQTVPAHATHQAGIAQPETPQRANLVAVFSLADPAPSAIRAGLAHAGRLITDLVAAQPTLTITVGVGPRVTAHVDRALLDEGLPVFRDDTGIAEGASGGDLVIVAAADDPLVLEEAIAQTAAAIPGARALWSQHGFRGTGVSGVSRNPFQFLDGIIIPRTPEELNDDVWIADGPFAGGTICVIRRLRLDTAAFRALPISRQEAIFGRRRIDGAPLSGGTTHDEVDLTAKTATGQHIVPEGSHVRAAHPSFTGSGLMLRRSYAYDAGAGAGGMLFICFQQELSTFVRTQHRLDEVDDLAAFETPTASGAWVMLPGFDGEHPLGSTI